MMNLRILSLVFVSLSLALVGCGQSSGPTFSVSKSESTPDKPEKSENELRSGRVGVFVSHETEDYGKITSVKPGSPAENAGIKVGDKIVTVDGKALVGNPYQQLRGEPGSQVEIVITRNGQTLTFTMVRVDRKSIGM